MPPNHGCGDIQSPRGQPTGSRGLSRCSPPVHLSLRHSPDPITRQKGVCVSDSLEMISEHSWPQYRWHKRPKVRGPLGLQMKTHASLGQNGYHLSLCKQRTEKKQIGQKMLLDLGCAQGRTGPPERQGKVHNPEDVTQVDPGRVPAATSLSFLPFPACVPSSTSFPL